MIGRVDGRLSEEGQEKEEGSANTVVPQEEEGEEEGRSLR